MVQIHTKAEFVQHPLGFPTVRSSGYATSVGRKYGSLNTAPFEYRTPPAFWVSRNGRQKVVRPHRYALAIELGRPLTDDEVALHEVCDNPICVRASSEALGRPHVVLGTQAQNLAGMGAKGRGGGRGQTWHWYGPDRAARAARSRALREAVRGGWDDDAVQAAFLHTDTPTLF